MKNNFVLTDLAGIERCAFVFWDFYSRRKARGKITEFVTGVFIEFAANQNNDQLKLKTTLKKPGKEHVHYIKLNISVLSKINIGEVFEKGVPVRHRLIKDRIEISDLVTSNISYRNIGDIYIEKYGLNSLFNLEEKFLKSQAYFFSYEDYHVLIPLSVIFKRFCCYDPEIVKKFFSMHKDVKSMGIFKSFENKDAQITIDLERHINKSALEPLARYIYFSSFFDSFCELQQKTHKEFTTSQNSESPIYLPWPYGDSKCNVQFEGCFYNYLGGFKVFIVFDIGKIRDQLSKNGIKVRGTTYRLVYPEDYEPNTNVKTRYIRTGKIVEPNTPSITGNDVSVDPDHKVPSTSRLPDHYFDSGDLVEDLVIEKEIKPGKTSRDEEIKTGGGVGENNKESDIGEEYDNKSDLIPKTGLFGLFENFKDELDKHVLKKECAAGVLEERNLIFIHDDQDFFYYDEVKNEYQAKYSFDDHQVRFCFMPIDKGRKIDELKRKRRITFINVRVGDKSCFVLEIEPQRSHTGTWFVIMSDDVEDIRNLLLAYVKNFGGSHGKDGFDEFIKAYPVRIYAWKHPIHLLKNEENKFDFTPERKLKYAKHMIKRVLDQLRIS